MKYSLRNSVCLMMTIAGLGIRTALIGGTLFLAANHFMPSAHAQQADAKFQNFIQTQIWPKAQAAGIDRTTFERAFANIKTPDNSILQSAGKQAEFVSTVQSYVEKRVSDARVRNGLAKLNSGDVAGVLRKIEQDMRVDPYIILSIWGMESSYGEALKGDTLKNIFRSMATLAYADPKRKQFGMDNTIAALKIVKNRYAELDEMVGSWAGGMGHTQFIPTSYLTYAQDFDGDGHFDIWNNVGDALASAAAHLTQAPGKEPTWIYGEPWGVEVTLPMGFNLRNAFDHDGFAERSVGEWQSLGIRAASGGGIPASRGDVSLYLPAGANGPAFLLYQNFTVIKRYNKSNSYALSVGLLADRLRGDQGLAKDWPGAGDQLTDVKQISKLQQILTQKGLYDGKIDGFPGPRFAASVHQFQTQIGMQPADGIATQRVFNAAMHQ